MQHRMPLSMGPDAMPLWKDPWAERAQVLQAAFRLLRIRVGIVSFDIAHVPKHTI
jgi:hypothetical protein